MNKHLAFAGISIKSYDEELREFEGIATHISPDKVKDVVEPSGAEFKLPLPFLSKHKHDMPVGKIIWAKVEKDGIRVRGQLPKVSEPGLFKDRVDEAWHELKYLGDTMGLSIGFAGKEYDMLPSGGMHFKKWRWDELSLVTVPCHGKATIEQIKSAYASEGDGYAATGNESAQDVAKAVPARVESKSKPVVKLAQAKGNKMSKLQESLKAYQDALDAKKAERTTTVTKSLDEGRTVTADEKETIDTLTNEIKALEDQIEMVKGLIASDVATAKAVAGTSEEKGVNSRTQRVDSIKVQANQAEKGLAIAQLVRLQYQSGGNAFAMAQIAESQKGAIDPRVVEYAKASVPAATTTNPTWAGNLITQGGLIGDFVEYLRPKTIVGRIPGLRSVPFNVPLVGQTSGGQGYWVGENRAKPLTQWSYGTNILQPLKVANIAVITEELLKRASVAADNMIRDELVRALQERLDTDFVDPAKAAVAGVSPASITNGVTGIASSGNDAAAIRADIAALMAGFLAANNIPSTGVYLMRTDTALMLSMMQNPLGQSEFPGIGMDGGTFMGLPALVSDYVPVGTVILANASDIYFADEGGFDLAMSREASLEMADNPTHKSGTPTGAANMVSMFQTNSVAFRCERHLNWAKRRPGAVQMLTGVQWGAPVTPEALTG